MDCFPSEGAAVSAIFGNRPESFRGFPRRTRTTTSFPVMRSEAPLAA